jgi:hypothetical protein
MTVCCFYQMADILVLCNSSRTRRTKQSLALVFLDLLNILAHLNRMNTVSFEDCVNFFE